MPVPENAAELVQADVESVFREGFPDGTFQVAEPFAEMRPIATADVAVVPWFWSGTHTGDFREVRRTGLPVEFAGTTFVTDSGEGLLFHRVVDWLSLYRQLGLMMVCRRPRTEGTEDADFADRPEVQDG